MNYTKIYEQLIERAQLREMPNGYCEIHHIVPRCFYGSNDDRNLVALTAREHFIAHRLLAKMRPWHNGLLRAVSAFMMNGSKQRLLTSRQFEIAKESLRRCEVSLETRTRMSRAQKGLKKPPCTEEYRLNMSRIKSGVKLGPASEDTKAKLRKAWITRGPVSNETKAKQSAARKGENNPMFGRKHTDSAKVLISAAHIGRKATEQEKAERSAFTKGENNPMFGRKHTPESKAKMSETRKANKALKESKCR